MVGEPGARVSLKSLTEPKGLRQAGMVTVFLIITGCTYRALFDSKALVSRRRF
jgi:hypothetical protein